jgi:type VI secretion system protein ImpG
MDRRLLGYYNRELKHIRESAAEFAREFPKIAARLGVGSPDVAVEDPYVERLLEGFAFLAARVQVKLDAEFPRFTQGLLETVYPHYLAPTPSMTIVQFKPDLREGSLAEGFTIKRGSALRSMIGKGDQTACDFRTSHDVTLYPIEVVAADYQTRGLATLQTASESTDKAGIRIRLRSHANLTFDKLKLDRLALHLSGTDETPARLFEQILAHARAVVVQPVGNPVRWHEVLPASSIRPVGFEDSEALLPHGARSFQGYRLLQEYFSLPQRFLFLELSGLQKGLRRCKDTEVDIVILLRQANLDLENALSPSSFAPFCAPAINLFRKRTDRIHITERFSEYQVIPDRTRPLDFEVFEVHGVTGFGESTEVKQEFLPFYSARDTDPDGAGRGAYFTVSRVPRVLSQKEKLVGKRSEYAGSETFVTLVDANEAPYSTDLQQLGIETLCTNRHLALNMPKGLGRTDFTMEEGAPVESIRCLAGPTPPRPSFAEGETAWRLISHFALNYYSLADSDVTHGAAAMRDLLKLYADWADPSVRKQIEGVKSIATKGITRRSATPGPISFARGLEVTTTFDETGFEGTGVFILGAVLDHFFARYVSINSFTETVIRTQQRGEIMRWPARIGVRHII